MAFVHDAADAFAGRAAYTRTLPVSELFELDPTDAGQNDTHKKQNIIKAVKDAHTKITAMQTAMKNASDDEKMILCEEANEVYQACLKTVSRNVANDHILGKEKTVETTAGCILRLKINIAVLDINGEAWYNVTKISAYQSK